MNEGKDNKESGGHSRRTRLNLPSLRTVRGSADKRSLSECDEEMMKDCSYNKRRKRRITEKNMGFGRESPEEESTESNPGMLGQRSHSVDALTSRDSRLNYARLMQYNVCYEAMPNSSKLVVFDTELDLKKAFNGLIYQNTRHVLLSDAEMQGNIVGILSVTDFIRVLLRLHRVKSKSESESDLDISNSMEDSSKISSTDPTQKTCDEEEAKASTSESDSPFSKNDIGKFTIKQYREIVYKREKSMNLISVYANESLLKACRLLSTYRIHRLPVIDPDTGSPLFILTHKRILKFIWLFGQSLSLPEYHMKSCKNLGIGTWSGVRVVFPDTPILDCLNILITKNVSGLPVVERNTYKVIDMYSRFDAIGIAIEDKINHLSVTVSEALAFRNTFREERDRVVSMQSNDSLWQALTILVNRNVHRLCALKSDGSIEGLVSLSDVMNFLVVQPGASLSSNSPLLRQFPRHSLVNLPEGPEPLEPEFSAGGELSSNDEISQTSSLSMEYCFIEDVIDHRSTKQLNQQLAAFTMN